jgi:hypothetical protein
MTNWKTLQDTNPEPSLLDAIAHAEKQQLEGRHTTTQREWLDWVGENGDQSLDVLMAWANSFMPSDVGVVRPRKLGDDK